MKKRNVSVSLPYLLLLPTFAFVIGLIGYPIFEVIRLSLTNTYLLRPEIAKFVGLETFLKVLKDPVLPLILRNTILWIVGGVGISIIIGTAVGYFLSLDIKINRMLRAVILVPWILPEVVTASTWRWMLHVKFGVINDILLRFGFITEGIEWLGNPKLALFSLTGVLVWRSVPLIALLMSAAIQGISVSLLEAATIDGASRWQKFWQIIMPMVRPIFTILLVVNMIWVIQRFAIIWTATEGGPVNSTHIFTTYIYEMAFTNFRAANAAALSIINLGMLGFISAIYLHLFRKTN